MSYVNRYIKQVDGKWYDVHVEFDENDIGNVVDVKITDEMPELAGCELLYAKH
jgi:hypothetical protein